MNTQLKLTIEKNRCLLSFLLEQVQDQCLKGGGGGQLGTSLQRPPTANDSSSCPCNKSDSSSSKVICASCSQSWHQNCCNLKHLTPACIKKLTEWTCPKCYVCPLIKSNLMAANSEAGSLTETIKNCSTEVTKSSSAIESLNPKIASLEVKVTELVNKIESFSKAKHIMFLNTAMQTRYNYYIYYMYNYYIYFIIYNL